VLGVTLGGTLGHALCTGLAVIGGRLIAQKISVKTGKLSTFLVATMFYRNIFLEVTRFRGVFNVFNVSKRLVLI
jgi:putative Ca2+/H+ antiporter (TMEM165/GDT1 family)